MTRKTLLAGAAAAWMLAGLCAAGQPDKDPAAIAMSDAGAAAPASRMPAGADDRGVIQPANGGNDCATASLISGFSTWTWDLVGATTDGLAHPQCNVSGSNQVWRDRWWVWSSPVTGEVTLQTCGLTTLDTRIVVYAPSAPCLTPDEYVIACNDDACSLQSRITFLAQAGQKYLLRLGRFGVTEPAASGFGEFSITSAISPDVCAGQGTQCRSPLLSGPGYTSDLTIRTADDFVAPATGAINGLCWWGRYLDADAPNADIFRITYWSSVAGLPGTPLATFTPSSGLVVARADTGLQTSDGDTLFQYSASHLPVPVADGERYWVEVRNTQGVEWFWQSALPGDGGFQDFTPTANWQDADSVPDLAFCLKFASGCGLDVTGDGEINFADLNRLLSSFNTSCP